MNKFNEEEIFINKLLNNYNHLEKIQILIMILIIIIKNFILNCERIKAFYLKKLIFNDDY